MHLYPCQHHDDEHGWQNETNAADNKPQPSCPQKSNMNCHLGGVRAGDKIRCAQHIKKLLVIQPFATLYNFIVHHGDMSGRSAKGGNTEFEKKYGYFSQSL